MAKSRPLFPEDQAAPGPRGGASDPPTPPRECGITVGRDSGGIVTITIAPPGGRPNLIDGAFLGALATVLDGLDHGPPPHGLLVRSGRPGVFSAGADVGLLEHALREPERLAVACRQGREVFARLSSRPWPSAAVIDGTCLGGGLELALACDIRVASSAAHTWLGFPEVKLGLLPGWGGVVRLPRLVGPGPAVELLASGETIDGQAAWRSGLVDAWVPADRTEAAARSLVERAAADGGHHRRRLALAAPVALDPAERTFLAESTATVIDGRTGGHYPAPRVILEAVLASSALPAAEAGGVEERAFVALARGDVARQLVRVFRLGERNRRDRGVGAGGDPVARPAPFSQAAVVGAGIMGAGIAALHLRALGGVTLCDVEPRALERAVGAILEEASWDRVRRGPDAARLARLAGGLRTSTRVDLLADADIVVESVLERTDVKRSVLAGIEEVVRPDAVIATNTSTNPITRLATALRDPSRFCGLHFFNPVRRMMLVEVVRGPATSDDTVARAVEHGKRLGKCPIVVLDSPGFLVNRMLMPYLHEAVEMLREGLDPLSIDAAARAFGMPMGPLELYDMIGLDTAFYAGLVLADAYRDRIDASPVVPAMVKSGRLGRKSGGGFYRYSGVGPDARVTHPDEGITDVVAPYRLPAHAGTADAAAIVDRLLLPMVLEATLVLDEGIVRDARDIDLAVIHALGFPPFRGGLLAWADGLGAGSIVRRLEELEPLGTRMRPTPRLVSLARCGGRFTD